MINIVLVEPEIPQNTGNIARTCAVTGSVLHLVGPLGFKIDDAKLKRAGLDYWHLLDIRHYADLNEYLEKNPGVQRFYATTHGSLCYSHVSYPDGCHILFGKETAGLPHWLSGRESRRGFTLWSRKTPQSTVQLSPCVTTTEARDPVVPSSRGRRSEKPEQCNEE